MKRLRVGLVLVTVLGATFAGASPVGAASPQASDNTPRRFIAVAKTEAEVGALKSDVERAGGRIVDVNPAVGQVVAMGTGTTQTKVEASAHAATVGADRIEKIGPPESSSLAAVQQRFHIKLNAPHPSITPDPAFSLPGLMWSINRIKAPGAWNFTAGSDAVTVGVADTGLDFTHSELAPKVVHVEDFTTTESPEICKDVLGTGVDDAILSATYGGPATTDWNGHGSWIGGNIAGALDGVGINGAAPKVKLVSLKISQWCGSAYDSEIIDAFTWAADHQIDVVSISFGGYLDRTDPEQEQIYQQYVKTVRYAAKKGTVIVAAAGNEHVRVGAGGRVISHGPLTTPGTAFEDLYGLYETPGGIPGVVDVSSTGNVVSAPSAACDPSTIGTTSATCKPLSDPHQPFGVGRYNQLAYYSNYGPRIDVAAPGGARKYNLPAWDRGGTPGFPVTTADGFTAFEDFSITSNWATQIPCYTFGADAFPYFYTDECYSTIQGTSMATPHASAAVALLASRYPGLRHHPAALVELLKVRAQPLWGNRTPALSATDTSVGDLTGAACPTGYCHLGGPAISDRDAYGAGLVDAYNLVRRGP